MPWTTTAAPAPFCCPKTHHSTPPPSLTPRRNCTPTPAPSKRCCPTRPPSSATRQNWPHSTASASSSPKPSPTPRNGSTPFPNRAALAARLEDARSAQESNRELTPTLNLVEKQLEAARRRDALDQQISAARKVLSQAEKDFEQAAKTYIDIRRRRTDGIVAELASRLVDGEDCPVCGSPTHPAPATAQPGQPTAADEQAAEAAHTRAQQSENKAKQTLAHLNEQAATARGEAGGDTPLADLTAHRTTLEQHLADALSQASDAGPASEQLALLEKEQAETEHTRNTATARLGAADATYDSLHTQREELTHRLATALNGHATLADRITALTQHAGRLEAAATCAATVTATAASRHSAATLAEQAAHAAGFTSPAEASAARLPTTNSPRSKAKSPTGVNSASY
ncbi:hypothetical protein [Streptomyces coelicoflavus]|uniref:hypothetical protein n=1 Tax=Streptomyces coelicoflavus TaxID=285562 RepID=UPI001EF211D1